MVELSINEGNEIFINARKNQSLISWFNIHFEKLILLCQTILISYVINSSACIKSLHWKDQPLIRPLRNLNNKHPVFALEDMTKTVSNVLFLPVSNNFSFSLSIGYPGGIWGDPVFNDLLTQKIHGRMGKEKWVG